MNSYVSNTTIAAIAKRILQVERILVTTHTKPDGDALGSGLALVRALTAKGKSAHLYLMGPIEPNLLTLAARTPFRRVENEVPGDEYDLAIITDTGAWTQLELIAEWLKKNYAKAICLDHHTRGDDVAGLRFVNSDAVSATAIVLDLLDEMGCEITGGVGGVAEALFTGLATDSGWFRYGNAGVGAFQMAARLLECGVDKSRLYQIIEETFGPQRLALEARALASLEYARNGAAAIQSLRMQDFQITGASSEDVTGLVNTPMTVGAVRVSILLTQTQVGQTKLSFRSKPAPPDGDPQDFVDVNVMANEFGGGGHVHAAGARINKDIDEAKAMVLSTLR